MSKQVNYNENLCAGAAIRDDKGRRISKLFEASHPKMTVGYAKNLIMPDDPTEQEFNFRQSGGGFIEDGVAVIDKVKGNSVVWNQLIGTHNTKKLNGTVAGVTISTNPDESVREYTLNGTATEDPIFSPITTVQANKTSVINGHKYLIFSVITSGAFCQWKRQEDDAELLRGNGANIIAVTTNGTLRFNIRCAAGTEFKNEKYIPRIIDLTQMFGAGNEPTTYEEFLQRKPKVADEYAYNEGTIVNNKVEKVVTTGRNLWDEQWEQGSLDAQGLPAITTASIRSKEFNRCLPNCEICFSCQSAAAKLIYWYDVNKTFISQYEIPNSASIYGVTTSPANAYFFKVRNDKSTYNNDICINLSDPSINGKYFPYEKHELDLSWVKEIKDAEGVKLFEDGMKSAGTAFDEVGKNKAVKRIRKYVFDGSEPISSVQLNDDGTAFKVVYTTLFETTSIGTYNAVSIGAGFYSKYDGGYYFDLWAAGFASVRAYIICVPSSVAKTSDEMKEYLKQKYDEGNPLVVYYELAEPIEVEYDEKSLTYPVIAGGTEEAIASEPSSAFRADIGYGIDAVKTILDLKARVEALEGK